MRHEVRPGLECAMIKTKASYTWNDQFENDIWYIENCSFIVDVKMLVAIVKEVFKASNHRVEDTRPEYDGSNLFYDVESMNDERKCGN